MSKIFYNQIKDRLDNMDTKAQDLLAALILLHRNGVPMDGVIRRVADKKLRKKLSSLLDLYKAGAEEYEKEKVQEQV